MADQEKRLISDEELEMARRGELPTLHDLLDEVRSSGPWKTGTPPGPGEYIVTATEVLGDGCLTTARFWNGMCWVEGEGDEGDQIVAWMPMPEPYRGGND